MFVVIGLIAAMSLIPLAQAASFPGNSRVEIADTSGSLSWSSTTNALTVSCWFKLTLPSDFTLTEDMAILVNSRTKNTTGPYAYAIYLNATNGNIEFSSKGTATEAPQKLIEHPYIERWYHVAVVRSGTSLQAYVDGRVALEVTTGVGDSRNTDGVSIGGWGDGKYLRGEVQEVSIHPFAVYREFIAQYMFSDLPIGEYGPFEPAGYYKLAYSSNAADQLKNFALAPPTGTNPATTQGSGTVTFDSVDKSGEQSSFDSQRNQGRNATTALSGGFSWSQSALSRQTPGVPFEFHIGYDSGNAFNGNKLGTIDPFQDAVLGSGWRHSFDTRMISSSYIDPMPDGTNVIGLQLWNGGLEVWDFNSTTGIYTTRHKEYRGELRFPYPTACEWVTPDRLIYKFQTPFFGSAQMRGRLLQIRDFNGNSLDITWNNILGRISKVTDNFGGEWLFSYLGTGRLEKVTGLGWTVTFGYDTSNRLISKSITGPADYATVSSTLWQFAYTDGTGGMPAGLLKQITDPKGKLDTRITYDAYGRKNTAMDAIGRTTQFEYNKPTSRQLTTTQLHGSNTALNRAAVETFDRKLHLLSRLDPMGFTTSFEYDDFGNVKKSTDARGNSTVMTYDARSNILTRINALNEKTEWKYEAVLADATVLNKPTKDIRPATAEAPNGWENRYEYDGAGNLLFHRDAPVGGAVFGTLASHVYGLHGLVTSSKDANGNDTRFAYDPVTGFLTSRTIAFGTPQAATWNITRTELGWPVTDTNPLNETTTLAYNVNGQVVSTTDAIARVFKRSYDANGNLTTESDGKGVLTQYGYDDANQKINRTDRLNNIWTFTYTPFREPETSTSPAAISDGTSQQDTFTRTYDKNGRAIKETDTYGKFVSYEYDANGNQTAIINKIGQRSKKSYDVLNRVITESDPLGNTRRTSYDSAGRVLVIISPNGLPTNHGYDGRSRLTKWTDPEGASWIYQYDGVGNILDIEDAEHGHYLMTYGPRNERLTERNQDLKTWTYTYDELIRLKTQANPPGTGFGPGGGPVTRTILYDHAGRPSSVVFNTGRTNTIGYDNNNNINSVARTDPGKPATALGLDYDSLDRLLKSTDTFSNVVGYEYDALSRVTKKKYPGGKDLTQEYDRLGRLKKLSFAYSTTPLDCTFSYDDVGRLTGRTYPNGITQTNTFDTASRVNSMGYAGAASPPIALTYAYDRNGNKTAGTEKGTLPWQGASLADYDDTSRFKPDGKLIDRTDAAASGGPRAFTYAYDDAGNMTLASAPGESYALAYDEDNRTISITNTVGATQKQLINRYDALGRRISRTLDGTETRYVLDLTGSMERILCETDASGTIQAWYVHGADLCFRVSATGVLTCYHADATGSIVRTTTAAGATRNQYAYTPYGQTIPVTGSAPDADDPYRFVGSQGVMQDLPSLYFMRARYFSAEAGVFMGTDQIKLIRPGWRPNAYGYAADNPLSASDPSGNIFVIDSLFLGAAKGVFDSAYKDIGGQALRQVLISSGVSETNADNAVMITGDVYTTLDAAYKAYTIASKVTNGYLPISEGGEFLGGFLYDGIAVGCDYVETNVWHPMGYALGTAIFGSGSVSTPSSSGGSGSSSSTTKGSGSVGPVSYATSTNAISRVKPAPATTPVATMSTNTGGGSSGGGSSGSGGSVSSSSSVSHSSVATTTSSPIFQPQFQTNVNAVRSAFSTGIQNFLNSYRRP